MSILKNFVNPWESGGGLSSRVLDTNVLENNILELSDKNNSKSQSIIPIAYLFADNSKDVTNNDLINLKKEVLLIFKKNNLELNIKIVKKEYIQNKSEFKGYELGIGVVDKPNAGSSIGFSRFKSNYDDSPYSGKRKRYLTNKLEIYHGIYLHTRVSYQLSKRDIGNSKFYYYPVAYHIAHELLHQMIIKAFCQLYYSKKSYTEFEQKNIFIQMGVNDDQFELHANQEENLNLEGSKVEGLSRYRPKSSTPTNLEQILPKHKDLISFWLNPKLKGPLLPYRYFLVEDWENKA